MARPLLATLIRRLHLAIRAEIHDALQDAGFADLTPAHIYVFQLPGPDGARPTELAERTNMTKQAMNHLLAGLEQGGYLDRVPAEDDGRARVVRLSARGREVMRVAAAASRRVEAQWAQALGRDQLEDLRRLLADADAATGSP